MMYDGRCVNCDARYCGSTCYADNPLYVYVAGRGWTNWNAAVALEEQGYRVDWRRSRVPQPGNGRPSAAWTAMLARKQESVTG